MFVKIHWREVFKFLCGAAFVGAFVNLYLWANNIPCPSSGGCSSLGSRGGARCGGNLSVGCSAGWDGEEKLVASGR